MRQLSKGVGANRTAILCCLVAYMMLGCHAKELTPISKRFNVCAEVQSGMRFQSDAPGPDFETGVFVDGKRRIDVLIGGHPGFTIGERRRGEYAKGEFTLIAVHDGPEGQSALFAMATGQPQGPLFVRLTTNGSAQRPNEFRDGFIRKCRSDGNNQH